MKKIFLIFLALFFISNAAYSENFPTGPVKTPVSSYSNTSANLPMGSLVKQFANAVLNDSSSQASLFKQLEQQGVQGISVSVHENGCPYRKGLPSHRFGDINVGGKQKCAIVDYLYDGQQYTTGACK